MHIELTSDYQTCEVPSLFWQVPIDDESVKAFELIGSILEEESPSDSIMTICLNRQSIVIVEPSLHSDYIFVVIIGEHDVSKLILDEYLWQERQNSPESEVISRMW